MNDAVREAAIQVVMAKDKFGALSMPASLAAAIERLRAALGAASAKEVKP